MNKNHNLILLFSVLMSSLFLSCSQANNKTNDQTEKKVESKNSIYQLEGNWTTQDNNSISLNDLKGKVQVVAMIFTHCKYACPRIVADMQNIESKIPENKRNGVHFTLFSFDVARDSVARLKEFSREMNLNSNWTLLRANDNQVRELSMLLNVNYEKQEDGSFAHSNIITVLNQDGEIVYRQEGLETDPENVVAAINSLVN